MNFDNFKKVLTGMGIATAVGLVAYFSIPQEKGFLTWEEYQDVIKSYNIKIESIKNNCGTDTRCVLVGNEKRIIFKNIKDKKDIINKFNKWISDDDLEYKR